MTETVPPGTPGPDSVPVTDAAIAGVPGGSAMVRLAAKASARRDNIGPHQLGMATRQSALIAGYAASGVMTVAPAPGCSPRDIDGQPYPLEGKVVPIGDVYAHRRLRDRSLVRINTEG